MQLYNIENTVKLAVFAAAKLVKLAAILPQRKNSQVSSNFACSEQFCSRLFWL